MRKGTCKNYRSPIHCETCSKGINYLELSGGEGYGYIARLPCTTTSLSKNQVPCEMYEEPSDRDIQKFENWYELEMKKIRKRIEKCTLR